MLDPVPLDRSGAGRDSPPGNDPRRGKITLLAEVGAQNPRIEIFWLHPVEPALEHAERRVDGHDLMGVERCPRADGAGVGAVLPEQGADPGPVAPGEAPFVAAQELVDRVFVPPGTRWGTIFDPAPEAPQEADTKDREMQAAQTDRWCVSS